MDKTPPSTGKFEQRQRSMTGSRNRDVQSFLFTSPEGGSRESEDVWKLEQENQELRSELRSRKYELERSTM